jgi:hypothetical protein
MMMVHTSNPFQHVQQMMMGFGGFHDDPFLSNIMVSMGMGGMTGIHDPFEDMFGFSESNIYTYF